MTSRFTRPALFLVLFGLLGLGANCGSRATWVFPVTGSAVTTFSFQAELSVGDADLDPANAEVILNDVAVPFTVVGSSILVSIDPGPPLLEQNELVARVPLQGGNGAVTKTTVFSYEPPGKARAFEIMDPADLLTGPLAHNRIGDYQLTNDVARFVVQRALVRDLHSVGQFGGALIDAELRANPGSDNFFEMAPSVNIETVVNPTSVTILNDGADGTAAIVEACGPDDLIDYINASSQVAAFGVMLPPGIDDQDYDVTGCTQYVLEPRMPGEPGNRVSITTTITNHETQFVDLFPGDYLNGMGELEQYTRLDPTSSMFFDAGIGELTAIPGLRSFSYFGFGQATGVSYGRIGLPVPTSPFADSSFSTSGVSFVLTANSVTNVLLPGADPPTLSIPPGGSQDYSRVFVVGDGDLADVIEAELDVSGTPQGTVSGCVFVDPASPTPAPGARVTVGELSLAGQISEVVSGWVARSDGCFSGNVPVGTWGLAAARDGTPYEGGATTPVVHTIVVSDGGSVTQDVILDATGGLQVGVTDGSGSPIPARVTVVGFDPSPEPVITFNFLGFFVDDGGTFKDITKDPLPYGVTAAKYTGADGSVAFDLEPGDYQVLVSRGTEYSIYEQLVTVAANTVTPVTARIARVLDTPGFVSSDFHVHSINSPDSRISLRNRVEGFAGEGVENFVATDHDARTDPDVTIEDEGLVAHLAGTIGEEITTFDTGHYNGYPLGIEPLRPSRGSTDWGRAELPGRDFPSYGAYIRTPAEIHAEVLNQLDEDGLPLNTSPDVVVQINHIGSHFVPLKIDTSLEPPRSFLGPGEPEEFRLDPAVSNFFHLFPALELWNGMDRSHQAEFTDERIGIWMNLLNQGMPSTFIADTDTHTFLNLRQAGARTWTASPTDAPRAIDSDDVGASVLAGRATGGQGIYLQAALREADARDNVADLSWPRSTTLATAGDGNVELVIDIQAPVWAEFDTVEIYANAATRVAVDGTYDGIPVEFSADPTQTLVAGSDFSLPAPVVVDPSVPGAERRELQLVVPFALLQDTWFVVLVKGSDGVSQPMFPVYASDLDPASNPTLADLLDGNLGQGGTMALAATNALFADVDGNPGFDPPGVQLAP